MSVRACEFAFQRVFDAFFYEEFLNEALGDLKFYGTLWGDWDWFYPYDGFSEHRWRDVVLNCNFEGLCRDW